MKNKSRFNSNYLVGLLTFIICGAPQFVNGGTVTVSATGISSSPIFVNSSLASLAVGTEFYIGTFLDTAGLNSRISTYKSGVSGTGNTLSEAQAIADAAAAALYSNTFNWLSNSANFKSLPGAANSISQTGGSAGKFLFASSATRTVNGSSASYAGATGSMDVTYANYGTGLQLWAWYATGSEIGIFTDSTWVVPTSPTAPLTVGSAALSNSASEILLGTYTDYASGSDLIGSSAISKTVTVIPEPTSSALFGCGALALSFLLARKRKEQKS